MNLKGQHVLLFQYALHPCGALCRSNDIRSYVYLDPLNSICVDKWIYITSKHHDKFEKYESSEIEESIY